MRFLRVSALNAIAVGVRMVTALALNKLLAIFVGPSGYAVIGQFQNAMSVAITLGSGATAQGVTRYTAEHHDEEARQHRVWRTAGTVTLIGSAIAALIVVPLSGVLARQLLHDGNYAGVFVALAIGLAPLGLNALLLAILNGRKDTRLYVTANVAGSLIGLIFTAALAVWYGLVGAMIALALNQSIAFAATALLVRRKPWFSWSHIVGRIDPVILRQLGRYALMAVTSALAGPLAQTAIRQDLVARLGLSSAGQWDAINRISAMSLLFFTSTMAVYYLPRIAEIRDNLELRREVRSLLRVIAPVVGALLLTIFLLRGFVVRLLFDARFLPMTQLFGWQMAGDMLKIVSWVYAYVMVGRGLTVAFIATEVGFSCLSVVFVMILTRALGLVGVSVAYALNYSLYLVAVYVIYHRQVRGVKLLEPEIVADTLHASSLEAPA